MKLSLKHLILTVALAAVLITMVGSTVSGYFMNKQNLIDNSLETNRVYAQKLAKTTDLFFSMTLQTLEQSAIVLAPLMVNASESEPLMKEADRLRLQTDTLNSIVISDAEGEVIATSPQTLELVGQKLTMLGGQQSLKEKKPFISEPYTSLTGRLIIFISHPIFSEDGTYLGFVGGSLYLLEDNFLNDLLGEHYYSDGSYVYVVDSTGRLIYHIDQSRINEDVSSNMLVQKVLDGQSGSERIVNKKGIDMLAGYSYVPISDWGVVSQRPTEVTLKPNEQMIQQMVVMTIPVLVIVIIVIILISILIASPLQKLATLTEISTLSNQLGHFDRVKAWYYEARQLKHVLTVNHNSWRGKVQSITQESHTDPLTKLMNRRTMDGLIHQWTIDETRFSLVIIDIDHFKRINDTYGHDMGDQVLIYLANKLQAVVGNDCGVCCRFGGEEFVVLLQNCELEEAFRIIERIRLQVGGEPSPCGDVITVSAGIADSSEQSDAKMLFQLADQRLYEAKNSGRNRSNAGKLVV